jgi:ABC-type antimicrobial peptide transport system permease subunit
MMTRVLEKLLFGVKPSDPATLGGVAFLLLVVAGVACYIPARRAARIDPLAALGAE